MHPTSQKPKKNRRRLCIGFSDSSPTHRDGSYSIDTTMGRCQYTNNRGCGAKKIANPSRQRHLSVCVIHFKNIETCKIVINWWCNLSDYKNYRLNYGINLQRYPSVLFSACCACAFTWNLNVEILIVINWWCNLSDYKHYRLGYGTKDNKSSTPFVSFI